MKHALKTLVYVTLAFVWGVILFPIMGLVWALQQLWAGLFWIAQKTMKPFEE